ncbi:MAG: hypothetical protein LBB95_00385 [Mycoplasmataceae bacterium]|nr:hypothetical protein [Mycoplasmataceae bacterium]
MEKIKKQQKKTINGGIAPMMAWVMITGACLAVSTIASIIPTNDSTCDVSNTTNSQNPQSYTKSNQKGFLRISPKISSSAFFLPI